MAGLLGDGWEDPRSQAIMALSGGLLQGNLGAGLLGANQAFSQAGDNALKKQLMQAQIAETTAQAKEREMRQQQAERQQQLIASMFPGVSGPSAGPAGGQGTSPAGAGGIVGLSQKLGIPPEAIQADLVFNGGKKIAELLADRSKPNWQNINGNLVNTSAPGFQGGFQPGMSASSDGRVTAWQPDGQGGLVVGAPRGALQTYGAYQGVAEGTKANFDPVTVTPAGQPPQMTTRGALVTNPQVQGRMVPPAQQAAMDRDRSAILQQELTKAQTQLQAALRGGDQSGAARAQADIAALQRELGGRTATVGMPLQSEEEKLRTTKGVEGDAEANKTRSKDVQTAKKFLSIADQAEALLKSGPTASGFGSMVDKGAAFFGGTTQGAVTAQQLKALGGWLVSNVPRMEGPQSNFDVANYQVQAADVANETLPVPRRLAALQTIKQMLQTQVDGGAAGDFGPPKPSAAPPKPMLGMVRGGYRYKGGDPASPASWEKM